MSTILQLDSLFSKLDFWLNFLRVAGTKGKGITSSQCLEVWPVSRKQAKTLYQHDRGRGEGNTWLE